MRRSYRFAFVAGAIALPLLLGLLGLYTAQGHGAATAATLSTTSPAALYAGDLRGQAVLKLFNQSVYGPDACTAAGDPVSPGPDWNPWWDQQEGTYHYQIVIPADYPYDVVRVELFDPDAINQITNTHVISPSATRSAGLTPATPSPKPCLAIIRPSKMPALFPPAN